MDLNGTGNNQLIIISLVHLVNNRFDPQQLLIIGENKQQEHGIYHLYIWAWVNVTYTKKWVLHIPTVGL